MVCSSSEASPTANRQLVKVVSSQLKLPKPDGVLDCTKETPIAPQGPSDLEGPMGPLIAATTRIV